MKLVIETGRNSIEGHCNKEETMMQSIPGRDRSKTLSSAKVWAHSYHTHLLPILKTPAQPWVSAESLPIPIRVSSHGYSRVQQQCPGSQGHPGAEFQLPQLLFLAQSFYLTNNQLLVHSPHKTFIKSALLPFPCLQTDKGRTGDSMTGLTYASTMRDSCQGSLAPVCANNHYAFPSAGSHIPPKEAGPGSKACSYSLAAALAWNLTHRGHLTMSVNFDYHDWGHLGQKCYWTTFSGLTWLQLTYSWESHPQQRIIWPKLSTVQRLRNPALVAEYNGTIFLTSLNLINLFLKWT